MLDPHSHGGGGDINQYGRCSMFLRLASRRPATFDYLNAVQPLGGMGHLSGDRLHYRRTRKLT